MNFRRVEGESHKILNQHKNFSLFFYSGGGENISPLCSARSPNLNLDVVLENNTQITSQDGSVKIPTQAEVYENVEAEIYENAEAEEILKRFEIYENEAEAFQNFQLYENIPVEAQAEVPAQLELQHDPAQLELQHDPTIVCTNYNVCGMRLCRKHKNGREKIEKLKIRYPD